MRLFVLTFVAVLATACFSDPEIGDPKLEGVCVYDAPLVFEGSTSNTARASLDLAQLDLDLDVAATSRVTMESAVVSTGPGLTNFGFANRVRVELAPRNQPAVPISEVAVSSRDASVTLDGNPNLDLAGYLPGNPDVAIEISGDVPNVRWVAVIDLCFDVAQP